MNLAAPCILGCALALGAAASGVRAEAPDCPNPPPAFADGGIMRHPEVAAAVREVAAAVERDRRRAGLASVAIAVVHGERVLLAAGFGCADVARGVAASPDTVYRVGSIAKLVDAIALMQLRDAGRLRLDDAVPGVRFRGPGGERVSATWRQLASHTAGLPRNAPPVIGTAAALFDHLAGERAENTPGTRYAYSNLGFAVLGQSLAALAGEGYHALVRRQVLEPLGMAASTFDAGTVPRDRLAAGYLRLQHAGDGWVGYAAGDRAPFPPSGALLSSASDLARLVALHLRRPAAGAQVLPPATIREMWRPMAATGAAGGAAGIGWFLSPYGPYTMAKKDGGQPGFTAQLQLLPELGLGLAALVNESPQRVQASGAAIAKPERLVLEPLLAPVARAAAREARREPPRAAAQATGAVARIDSRAANVSYQRASAGRDARQSSAP